MSKTQEKEKAQQREKDRKEQAEINKLDIVTDAHASATRSTIDSVVAKSQNIYFLSAPDGQVPMQPEHGYGLYYNDCRYLNGFEMKLGDVRPESLVDPQILPYQATFLLTNPDIELPGNKPDIPSRSLSIEWERLVDSDESCLYECINFHNYGHQRVEVPLKFLVQAEFEVIFAVRGQIRKQLGTLCEPQWRDGNTLHLSYEGADGYYRQLLMHFSTTAQYLPEEQAVVTELVLTPGEQYQLQITIFISESTDMVPGEAKAYTHTDYQNAVRQMADSYQKWKECFTEFESDNDRLNDMIQCSIQDLRTLISTLDGKTYLSAGVPWFAALVGRDSIISAYQSLVYDSELAENTLRLLASYQGSRIDDIRDEQPGKILHEYRLDEFTRMGKLPYDPSYGSIDSTALFLILLGQHAFWTGNLALFQELKENVERALDWICLYGDTNGDGFVDYAQASEELYNQGWKDSGNGIMDADGSKANLPIALVALQGYVYAAKRLMAELYRRSGDKKRARSLLREARHLKESFNRQFWMADRQFFALALHGHGEVSRVISSNPGQALWTGIVERKKAAKTVKRLMDKDMFSGWGIRCLSEQAKAYNPIGYHLGTIWPHDNSIIAAGFKRYGYEREACQVFNGLFAAACRFRGSQLPEVFAGFSREQFADPVHYPVAAHPQAWSAGSVPMFLTTLLGIQPNAFNRKLSIVRPILPDFVNTITVKRLKIGEAQVDLKFSRNDGGISVYVLNQSGDVNIVVQ